MFNKILFILALVTTPILTMQSARVDCGSAPSFLEKTHSEHQFINDLHNSQLIKATRFVQKAQDVMNKVCSDNTGDIFLQSRSKLEREQNMKIKSLHSDLKFIPTGENQAQKAIYQNLAGLATNLLQVESRRSEACLKAKVNIDRHSNVVSLIQHHHNKLRNNINTLNSFIQACSFQADDTQVITLPADGNVNQAITSAASNDACTENCDNVEVPAASSNTTEASGNVETGSGASTEASGQTESTTPVAETPSTGSSGTESSGSNAAECECAACPCENAGSTTTETPAEPSGQTETTTPSSETPVTTVETPVETNTGSSGCTVDCEPVEASTGTESESTPAPTEGSGQSSTETPTSEPATPTESSGNACTSGCETAGSGTESGQASTETPVSEPVETATPEVSECNDCGGATTETNTGTESGQASTETPVSEPVTPAQPAGNDCNECANTGTVTETVVPVQQPTESAQAPTETPVSEPAVPSTPSQGSECTTCGAVITVNVGDCADCGSNGGAAQAPTEVPVAVTPPVTSTCVETVSTGGSAQVPTEVPVSEPAQPAQPVSSGCNECGGAVQTETVTPAPTQTTEVIVIPTPTQTGQSSTETPVSQPATSSSGCNECGSSTGTVVTEQPAPSTTEVIVIPTPSAQTETVVPTSEPVVTPAPTTTCDCFECGCHSGTVVQQPPSTETITVTESVVPVGTTGQTETITPPAQTPEVPVSVPVASGCNECDGGADNGGSSGQVGGDIPISIGTVNVGGNDNGGCDGCFGISNGGNDGNGLVFALRGSGR